ncbi:MAG: sugar transferase [Terriglobia bacterium]|jgi:exopolysaccharide biosynthesis polyprenyl glycosylphosphotransferase
MGKNFPRYALLLADLVAIVVAFRIAYEVRYALVNFIATKGEETFASYWPAMAMALGAWIVLFRAFELDRPYLLGRDFPLAVSRLLMSLGVLMGALLAGSYLAETFYSRLLLIFLPPLLIVLFGGTRLLYRDLLKWSRKYGWGVRRVVIVGQSDLARELGNRIRQHQELNYELLGFLFPAVNRNRAATRDLEQTSSEEMARELASKKVDELIFTTPIRRETATLEFIATCQKLGIQVKLIPEYYDLHTKQIASFSIDGIPIFELREASLDPFSGAAKLLLDYSAASILVILFSPAILLISLSLAVLFKGHFLWRETRIGMGGQPFVMFRFNVSAADEPLLPDSRNWKARFCRFLHRYSLSELPQLWNVLKGDMGIVGPRPETPERVRRYSAWHRRRLQVKPGITGLAQVRGLRGLDSSDLKTKYDLEYVATFSLVMDLTLMVATINTLLRRRKAALADPGNSSPPPVGETLHANIT